MTCGSSSSRRAALVLAGRFVRGLVRGLGRLLLGLVAAGGLTALLVGVPWGLVRFIGWPLPDHMPSIEEVTTWLFHGTMGTDTLLALLAIALWIIWVFFVADVARSAVDAARGMRWPEVELPSTPGQWVASLLIGWLLLALLGHRGPPPALAAPHEVPTVSPVVATAPQHPGSDTHAPARKVTVTVAAPTAGTHDSLWRIAERHLGDGARWTEIWDLNKYRPQPDGRVFTQPDLIQPGWTLTLPATEHADQAGDHPHPPEEPPDPPQPPEQAEPSDGEPEATSPPGSTATPEQADTAGADDAAPPGDSGAVDLGNGVFLSLTVAAAISAALVAARHRFRRLWVLGRSSYDPMPVAPTVYELRLAHLAATHTNDPDGDDTGEHRERPVPVALVAADPTSPCGEPDAMALGVRDGVPVASKLARRGLGLAGPAANAAARAMLIALLTSETTQVVVPVDDLPLLIEDPPDRLPTALRIVPDLATALAELDPSSGGTEAVPGRLVLVASPPATPPDTARLRALLASGTASAAAILLGQYLPGATVYVGEDGTVAATSPGAATALQGTRMFSVTAPATTELLDLLADADVNLPPRQPADREPEAPPADRTGETTSPPAPEVPAEGDDTDGGRPRPATPTTPDDTAADTHEPDQPTERHAATPVGDPAASVGLRLTVLGPFTATLTAPSGEQRRLRLGNKTQELLTHLAVHRDGVGRDTLIADLWRDSTHSSRRTNNLNSALRRLRDALDAASSGDRPEVIVGGDNRVQLNPDTVGVDYWDFDDARTHARAATTDDQRHHAYRAQVAAYGGRLGVDLDDAEWVHGPDYNAQCAVVDALGRLAAAAETTDPQRALDLLETARGYDPANESLYGAIMRLQAALGYHDAIDRTLSLLEAELAERKDKPSAEIVGLARSLRRRHTTAIASQTPAIATHVNGNRPRTMPPQNREQSRSHYQ